MPTRLKRHKEPSHIHFCTIYCYRRLAFFWEDSSKQIVIDGLRDLQARHEICLIAYGPTIAFTNNWMSSPSGGGPLPLMSLFE